MASDWDEVNALVVENIARDNAKSNATTRALEAYEKTRMKLLFDSSVSFREQKLASDKAYDDRYESSMRLSGYEPVWEKSSCLRGEDSMASRLAANISRQNAEINASAFAIRAAEQARGKALLMSLTGENISWQEKKFIADKAYDESFEASMMIAGYDKTWKKNGF